MKKNIPGIQITERDINIMHWVTCMGFADINQIATRFNMTRKAAYARLRKLVAHSLLKHERLLINKPGHYRITSKGAIFSGSDIQPIRHISMGKYLHNKLITDLSLQLAKKYQGSRFISEREWRYQKEYDGVGISGHLCDGVLEYDGKCIAIELELTTKGRRRLSDILRFYAKEFAFDEVWYFCGSKAVKCLVEDKAKHFSFVKTFIF